MNAKIYILNFADGQQGIDLTSGADNNIRNTLQQADIFDWFHSKGLEVEVYKSKKSEWPEFKTFEKNIAECGQIWVISGRTANCSKVDDKYISVIKDAFEKDKKGLALWGDNDDHYAEANWILQALHPDHFLDGNTEASKPVERIDLPLDSAYEALLKNEALTDPTKFCTTPGFAPHEIMTGVQSLYAGWTVSSVSYCKGGQAGNNNNPKRHPPHQINSSYKGPLRPLLCSHDGCITTAFADKDGTRLLIDGGWTRLEKKHWNKASGTSRFVKNIACWLANEPSWLVRNPTTTQAIQAKSHGYVNPTHQNTSDKIQAIVKTVSHMHADVVCLQNVDDDIFKAITSLTTLNGITSHDGSFANQQAQDSVRILYNPSRVELVPGTTCSYPHSEVEDEDGRTEGISAQFILLTEALVIRRKMETKVKEIWNEWDRGHSTLITSRADLTKRRNDTEEHSDDYNSLSKEISTISDQIKGYEKNQPKQPTLHQSSLRLEKAITVVSALMFENDSTTRAQENAKKLMDWGKNTTSVCESHSFALGVSSKFVHAVLTRTHSNKDLELCDCHHLLEDPYEVTFPMLPCAMEASQEPPMMQDCIVTRANAMIPTPENELQLQLISSLKMVKYRRRKFEDGASLFDKLNPSPHAPLAADFGYENGDEGEDLSDM